MSDTLNVFIPITKVDLERREVWGYLTIEETDNAKEVLDYETSKPYFLQWSEQVSKRSNGKSKGNLRAMHQPIAAGKLISLQADDATKGIYIGAHVVDDGEWTKVQEGVYTGFSVGGSYVNRWPDKKPGIVRYTGKPSEASLVDAPCVGSAVFDVVKTDGIEQRLFKADGAGENVLTLNEQPVQTATISSAGQDFTLTYEDGSLTVTLAKANDALTPPAAIQPATITQDVVKMPVDFVQPGTGPVEADPEKGLTKEEAQTTYKPALNMESTVAPVVSDTSPAVNKAMSKIKVIKKTVKVKR